MSERIEDEPHRRGAHTFITVAPDAVRMCYGPRGESKSCISFATVSGYRAARYGGCRASRGDRLRSVALAQAGHGDSSGTTGRPTGVRREIVQAQQWALADGVPVQRSGQAVSTDQVREEVVNRTAVPRPNKFGIVEPRSRLRPGATARRQSRHTAAVSLMVVAS